MKRDQISLCALRAKKMGLSYGRYMAWKKEQLPDRSPSPRPRLRRTCPICGKKFAAKRDNQIYCCRECRERAKNRKKSIKIRRKMVFQQVQKKSAENMRRNEA